MPEGMYSYVLLLAESVTPIRRCPPYIPTICVTNRLTHLGVPVQWLRVMTKPVAFRRKLAKVVPPLVFAWTQSIDNMSIHTSIYIYIYLYLMYMYIIYYITYYTKFKGSSILKTFHGLKWLNFNYVTWVSYRCSVDRVWQEITVASIGPQT